jgi:hypothetical protein
LAQATELSIRPLPHFVPIPVFESFAALNAHLLECCRRRMVDCLRGHDGTIGERLERDLAALQTPLPAPYDACEKVATTVSSLSLVRYRLTTTQCRRPTVTAMFLYAWAQTDLNKKIQSYAGKNLATTFEFAQKLTKAKICKSSCKFRRSSCRPNCKP